MNKFKEISLLLNLKRVGKAKIYKNYWDILNQAENLDELVSIMLNKSNFSKQDLEKARIHAENLFKYIINSDINVITVFDDNYPNQLEVMENKRPLVLYVKGNMDALTKTNLAVIGTRKPSVLSQDFEEDIIKSIVNTMDIVIVSGLALGCDKIAHQTTIDANKQTIAILPSGVNVIKPAKHKKLAEQIIETGGCLVSEYEPDKTAFKSTYVERDQIVAAFSDATFVVECGVKSGTMHTVDAAKKFKRQIFAYLPKDLNNSSYDGNKFILENNYDAIRVESPTDILIDLKDMIIENENYDQQKLM